MDELKMVKAVIPLHVRVCPHERVLLAVTSVAGGWQNKITAVCLDCMRPVDVAILLSNLKSEKVPALRAEGLSPASGMML